MKFALPLFKSEPLPLRKVTFDDTRVSNMGPDVRAQMMEQIREFGGHVEKRDDGGFDILMGRDQRDCRGMRRHLVVEAFSMDNAGSVRSMRRATLSNFGLGKKSDGEFVYARPGQYERISIGIPADCMELALDPTTKTVVTVYHVMMMGKWQGYEVTGQLYQPGYENYQDENGRHGHKACHYYPSLSLGTMSAERPLSLARSLDVLNR